MADMDIEQLLDQIVSTPDCIVSPPSGKPEVSDPHLLPGDVDKFYQICGGVVLFKSSSYPLSIVPPYSVVPANPVIVGEVATEDISESWYIIADDQNGDYFTIDLSPERLGRCYDSFSDSHAIVGSSAIVATTFTDFLTRMLDNRGQHWYFLQADFASLGDAYDEADS